MDKRFYIVMLGPPGAGKGTQAKIISENLGLPHISSGDIFRENLKNQTELGKLAQTYMNRGELVPDDVTIRMIEDRLSRTDCDAGALLDGFPRTVAQAEALDDLLVSWGSQVDIVPFIKVSDDVLIQRLTGRWSCPQCGHVYHTVFNPPKEPGKCDKDGAVLYQRDDDKLETVQRRIAVYQSQTQPLIEYYTAKGVLVEINGAQSIEQVTKALLNVIKERMG